MKDGIKGEDVVNELDLIADFTKVDDRAGRKEITSDFTKAKLNEKQRETVIEMTSSAYFCKRIVENLRDNSRWYNWKSKRWEYYTKEGTKADEYEVMTRRAEYAFNNVMHRPFMTAILHRNIKDNYLLKLQAKASEKDDDEEEEVQEARKIGDRLREMFRIKGENETA